MALIKIYDVRFSLILQNISRRWMPRPEYFYRNVGSDVVAPNKFIVGLRKRAAGGGLSLSNLPPSFIPI